MVFIEKSFPRGGTKKNNELSTQKSKSNIIFGAVQKKFTKAKSMVKSSQGDISEVDNEMETYSAELLNYNTLQDGMNVIGMVKVVQSFALTIALPGNIVAQISALDISNSYTKCINEVVKNSNKLEQYKALTDMYKVGRIVYGNVSEKKYDEENHRTIFKYSLKPSDVHCHLHHMNVKKGFIFNGAIEEVQEHGYIIESGIDGLRTFMPLEKSQPGHVEGELVFMKVVKITHDKAASTCICKEEQVNSLNMKDQLDTNLDYIHPGVIVRFKIGKILKDGLQGTIMNETLTAYVNEHQLLEPLMMPEEFEIGSVIRARVLYVMPLTKFVYLSLHLKTVAESESQSEGDAANAMQLKRGDIIKDAKVHHCGTNGVILILDDKLKGIISYKGIKVNCKGNYDHNELMAKYAKNSKHNVRVIDYDMIDSLYLCTDNPHVLEEKIYTLSDIEAGEFVTAVVKEHNHALGGFRVTVGMVNGIIDKMFLSTSKAMDVDSKVRCRVISINTELNIVYLTNRPEYLLKSCKILSSMNDVKLGAIFCGTVVKTFDDYYLVKFFNNIKGFLRKSLGPVERESGIFYEGKTLNLRITTKIGDKFYLSLPEDGYHLGDIHTICVTNILESGLEVQVVNKDGIGLTSLIPIWQLSDYPDLLYAKHKMYEIGYSAKGVCIGNNMFNFRDVEYFENNASKNWQTVRSGDILKGFVQNVLDDFVQMRVPLPGQEQIFKISMENFTSGAFNNANIVLTPDQVIYLKILEKNIDIKRMKIAAELTSVWDGNMTTVANYMEKYLKEIAEIKETLGKQKNPIAKYTIGERIVAKFDGIIKDTGDWKFTLGGNDVIAVMKSSMVIGCQPPKVGQRQDCAVLWIDYGSRVVFITNKAADIKRIICNSLSVENSIGKPGINAKVVLVSENIFLCTAKNGIHPLVYCPRRLHFNDFENIGSEGIVEGDFCKLVFIDKSKPIAVREHVWDIWQDKNNKRKAKENREVDGNDAKEEEVKKRKIDNGLQQTDNHEIDKNEDSEMKYTTSKNNNNKNNSKNKKLQKNQKEENLKKVIADKEMVERTKPLIKEVSKKVKDNKKVIKNDVADGIRNDPMGKVLTADPKKSRTCNTLAGIDDFWNTDLVEMSESHVVAKCSEDEEDKIDAEANTKRKKLTATERFKQQREEEARLREIEEKYADPNHLPETVDQFDRLVLSDPNNSKHWINYMVFHLQSAEIDKAESVARRAIKAISFRCPDDQLNVWMALLNLKLRYGSKETFNEVLKEALTYNEPWKTYFRVIEILTDSERREELMEILKIVTKKFKQSQEAWRVVANAYFIIGMADQVPRLLHKALTCLPEREHVNTIVAIANLNHKHGHDEMAQTLMDQVVTSYPKRVDVWTQYVDMLIKKNLIDSARCILERSIMQKIPLKKMRTIFKKYLEFEERFGTVESTEKVKELAREYVKNNSNLK